MTYPYGEPLENLAGLTEFEGRDSVDLLARMIYSEARGEEWVGKQGVAHVAKNRKADGYWGDTYESVLLYENQFAGMTTLSAREPDLTSPEWSDSLYIASNVNSQSNPIGNRLYFLKTTSTLPSGAYNVMTIGNHYFFNCNWS